MFNGFMKKEVIRNEFNFWRYLINFWSVLYFIVIILDYVHKNAYNNMLNVMAGVYVSALAIYASNKEFERWYDKHERKHPGEIFVIIWSSLFLCLFLLSFTHKTDYQIPSSVVSSYIAVLTILAVTRKSKEMYLIKRGQNKKSK